MSLESLRPGTLDHVRQRIFDTACAVRAGTLGPEMRRLERVLPEGGAGPVDQVRLLCAATRETEIDDIHPPTCVTAGSVVVPVALVVATATGADIEAVLPAVVCGYEAMVRLGAAVDGANCVYAGVWVSHLAAPIGAAATAARVLSLDAEATTNALAMAMSRTTGVAGMVAREPSGRWLMFGAAAADGVLAAYAARRGLAGDPAILDAGLPRAVHVDVDLDRITASLGREWAIDDVDVKPFCTARQVQSAVEAAADAAVGLDAAEIDRIVAHVPGQFRQMIDRPDAHTRIQSILSIQFQIGLALTRPAGLYDLWRTGLVPDDRMRHVIAAVELSEAPELTKLYPTQWGAAVEIHTRSGGRQASEVRAPLGSAGNPLGWEGLAAKQRAIDPEDEHIDTLMEICRGLGMPGRDRGVAPILEHVTARARAQRIQT